MRRIVLVAAVARNGVIGGDNRLLWRLRSDLKRFRALTIGHPVIMGRKTYQSIGKPLPGRRTIVVSRDWQAPDPGVVVAPTPEAALAAADRIAGEMGAGAIMVVGGGEIYAATIGRADRLEITEVELAPDGDAHFPPIDRKNWRETGRETHAAGPDDDAAFAFVTFERKAGG